MYFLGKQNGSKNLAATFINNTQMVKQIAELSALEVAGSTTTKVSNAGAESGVWSNMKNYLAENTLQVSVPYIAKYGVDVSAGKISVNLNDTALLLSFPSCKLLTLQLQLDKIETMNQTGLFARTTVADMKLAEQHLYKSALEQLSINKVLIDKAKIHIAEIFSHYYKPLGYKVVCNFTQP
jgi:Protein of unknown function (DUF4230)